MHWRRSRVRVERPVDELGHAMGWGVEHVLIGGPKNRSGLVASGRRSCPAQGASSAFRRKRMAPPSLTMAVPPARMMMASRFRVNFSSHVADHLTGAAGLGQAGRPRTPAAAAENRQALGTTGDLTFPDTGRPLARSPVVGASPAALRGTAWMNAVRFRSARRLLADALPSWSVINWLHSSILHKQTEPTMSPPSGRSRQLHIFRCTSCTSRTLKRRKR